MSETDTCTNTNTNTDSYPNIDPDRVDELDKMINLIMETYTEEQIIYSIPKESTPEKGALEYIIPFVATNILEKKIAEVITGLDKFLDGDKCIFIPNEKADDLKKRCKEIKDSYECTGLQILILLNDAVMPSTHDMDAHSTITDGDLDIRGTVYRGLSDLQKDYLNELNDAVKLSQEIQELCMGS